MDEHERQNVNPWIGGVEDADNNIIDTSMIDLRAYYASDISALSILDDNVNRDTHCLDATQSPSRCS